MHSWFDAYIAVDAPNGILNGVTTREALERYDPGLATLIAGYSEASPGAGSDREPTPDAKLR